MLRIHEVCEARYEAISRGLDAATEGGRWEVTEYEFSTLQACIEHADGLENEFMQQIMRVYQVVIVWWGIREMVNLFEEASVSEDNPLYIDRLNQFYAIMDWITLRAITDALFDYARGEKSEPSQERMKNSISFTLRHIGSGDRHTGAEGPFRE